MDDKGIAACQWQCLRQEDIVALTSGDELLLSDDLGPIFVVWVFFLLQWYFFKQMSHFAADWALIFRMKFFILGVLNWGVIN